MIEFIRLCVGFLVAAFKSRMGLQAENLALRHQLCVYQRSVKRPKVQPADRVLWSLLARAWSGWKDALIFVKPDTVIRWQRKRFKEHCRRLSASGRPGRPPVAEEVKNSGDRIRTCDLFAFARRPCADLRVVPPKIICEEVLVRQGFTRTPTLPCYSNCYL